MRQRHSILCIINDCRITRKKNKEFFILAFVCAFAGFLLSLKGLRAFADEKCPVSLVAAIAAGEYPFIKIFLPAFFLPTLLCCSIILFSINYYSNFLYYLELIIANKVIFRNTLACLLCQTLYGALNLIGFVLPLLIFDLFVITLFWARVYEIVPYPCKKKILYYIPYRCYWKSIKKDFYNTLVLICSFNAVVCFISSLIFYFLI